MNETVFIADNKETDSGSKLHYIIMTFFRVSAEVTRSAVSGKKQSISL